MPVALALIVEPLPLVELGPGARAIAVGRRRLGEQRAPRQRIGVVVAVPAPAERVSVKPRPMQSRPASASASSTSAQRAAGNADLSQANRHHTNSRYSLVPRR
jgi:hypothetical protein